MSKSQEVSKNARGPQAWMTRDYAQDVLEAILLPGENEPVLPPPTALHEED